MNNAAFLPKVAVICLSASAADGMLRPPSLLLAPMLLLLLVVVVVRLLMRRAFRWNHQKQLLPSIHQPHYGC